MQHAAVVAALVLSDAGFLLEHRDGCAGSFWPNRKAVANPMMPPPMIVMRIPYLDIAIPSAQ